MPAEPDRPPAPVPATAGETTPERPWPLRLLSLKMSDYVARAPAVWVEGQVVQLTRRPGMSTCFLTLRDTDVDMSFSVTVSGRMLDAMPVPLADGARVVVHAKPELSTKRGSLQLAAGDIRPVGVGELLARLEHLRRLLASEGLFDARRKKALPFLPRVVGLVCGRASAAERDVVENARRRWPTVRFDVRQVAVQGPRAVEEVTLAIQALDREGEVDVIVVARGGGSLEDLLAFSNETLVRAAAAARTPLVSAIGHESDTPLLDLVADYRASTPTDAAKRVVPDVAAELAGIAHARDRATAALTARLRREEHQVAMLRERPALADPYGLLDVRTAEVDEARGRASRVLRHRLDRAEDDVAHLLRSVRSLSPLRTLQRGYAVVQTASGDVVRSPADVAAGARLRLRLAGGDLAATADGGTAGTTTTTTTTTAASPATSTSTEGDDGGWTTGW